MRHTELRTLADTYRNEPDEKIRKQACERLLKNGYSKTCEFCNGTGKKTAPVSFESIAEERNRTRMSVSLLENENHVPVAEDQQVCTFCNGSGIMVDLRAIQSFLTVKKTSRKNERAPKDGEKKN